jgi:hypothetical protein
MGMLFLELSTHAFMSKPSNSSQETLAKQCTTHIIVEHNALPIRRGCLGECPRDGGHAGKGFSLHANGQLGEQVTLTHNPNFEMPTKTPIRSRTRRLPQVHATRCLSARYHSVIS